MRANITAENVDIHLLRQQQIKLCEMLDQQTLEDRDTLEGIITMIESMLDSADEVIWNPPSGASGTLSGRCEESLDQHAPGAKLDASKQRPSLVLTGFVNALDHVIAVGTYGANKYTDDGWMHVPDGERRYMDAAWRHLILDQKGEKYNEEDGGCLHMAQAIWNLLAVLELRQRNPVE